MKAYFTRIIGGGLVAAMAMGCAARGARNGVYNYIMSEELSEKGTEGIE